MEKTTRRFALVLLVGLLGCQAQEPETPEPASNLDTVRTIRAGVGLDVLALGDRFDEAVAILGEPEAEQPLRLSTACHTAVFHRWFAQGLDLRFCDGIIDRMFFYFRHDDFTPFVGASAEGVGSHSRVEDLLAAYGEAEDRWTSPFGAIPLTRHEYRARGIIFAWAGDRLHHILVLPPP